MADRSDEKERWLRRQAVQFAGSLPEDIDDALAVLEYARELITDFVAAPKEAHTSVRHLSVVKEFQSPKD